MEEKELKRLNRKQLLELLLKQTERAEQLEIKLQEAEKKLQDKSIMKKEAGSIAEASLKLSGVFEAAEEAAAQYLENIKRLNDNQEAINEQIKMKYKQKAEQLLEQSNKRAEAIVMEAEKRAAEREAAAEKKIKEISEKLHLMYEKKKVLDEVFKEYSVIQDEETK